MRMLACTAALLLGACVIRAGGPAARPESPPMKHAYDLLEDQTYTPKGWPQALQADVYTPRHVNDAPAVLLIHGGGWTGGKRQDMNSLARRIAARGYVVVNVSYRFAPAYRHPAQIDDMHQALHWMRENHERLKIDPRRIAAWGYSAGAHLAALLGAADALPPDRVQAVVAGGLPADLRIYPKSPLIAKLMGTALADDEKGWTGASPIAHVAKGSAPTFLYHGSWDAIVGERNALDMKAALDAAGVDNELYRVRGLGHFAMFFLDGGAARSGLDFLDRVLR